MSLDQYFFFVLFYFSIAQTIEKYLKLFATVEAVSSGKHFYSVKDDVLNLIESFNYYACCAAQLEKDWFPTGIYFYTT